VKEFKKIFVCFHPSVYRNFCWYILFY